MTGVDWIIVALVLLLALFGWAQGFVSGVLAFAGLALGAWIGTRVGPLVLSEGAHSQWAPAFGLLGALLVGATLAGLFEAFGGPVRSALRRLPGFGAADGALGAVLIAGAGSGSSGSSARSPCRAAPTGSAPRSSARSSSSASTPCCPRRARC